MIHITITDTDEGEIVLDRDCLAIVGGITTADGGALEYVRVANNEELPLAFAVAGAVNTIRQILAVEPRIKCAIQSAFQEEGGDEE